MPSPLLAKCPGQGPNRRRLNARSAGVVLLFLALLLLAGCASAPRLASPEAMGIPPRVQLEGIPFHAQRDYQCGPASLAMLLNADGVEATVDELIPQVFLPNREGSVQPEMLATLRRHGRVPFVLEGRFEALLEELAAGHPVLVMQNLSLPAWPLWHYAVAIGYDLDAEAMIVHSGMEAARREDFRRFDATWARSERWAVVALPPGELPASLEPEPALQAVADFEQARGTLAALPAWEAVTRRWPQHAMGWFALGNARHGGGDPSGAAEAFRRATEADPSLAVAWLNLGLTLVDLEAPAQARDALERAGALPGPWQSHAEQALERL